MAPIKYAASAARAAGITGTPSEGFRLPRSCVRFANTGLVLGRAGQFSQNTKIDAPSVTPRANSPPDCLLTRAPFDSRFQYLQKKRGPLPSLFQQMTGIEPALSVQGVEVLLLNRICVSQYII